MRINGQKVNTGDVDSVIALLKTLPGGFGQERDFTRARNVTPEDYKDRQAFQCQRQAMRDLDAWQFGKDEEKLLSARWNFEQAIQLCAAAGDEERQAAALSGLAQVQLESGETEAAIHSFEDAIAIQERYPDGRAMCETLGGLHHALFNASKEKSSLWHRKEIGDIHDRMREIRARHSALFPYRHNEAPDKEAYRIEQGELGFSAEQKIGTDYVQDCICVIIRDPVTRKTALAHVDAATDVESLDEAFNRLPEHADTPLQVKLAGARYGAEGASNAKGHENSRSNIQRITDYLDTRDVEIVSAQIQELEQPNSIVVDPLTFTIEERFPAIENPDALVAATRPRYEERNRPLHVALDLTVSTVRAAVLLGRPAATLVNAHYAGRSDEEICAGFYEGACLGDIKTPRFIEETIALVHAYEESIATLKHAVSEKLDALKSDGAKVKRHHCADVEALLRECPIHVGEGAAKANQPIVEIIQNALFSVEDREVAIHADVLKDFAFAPNHAYAVIEGQYKDKSFQAKYASAQGQQKGATHVGIG